MRYVSVEYGVADDSKGALLEVDASALENTGVRIVTFPDQVDALFQRASEINA